MIEADRRNVSVPGGAATALPARTRTNGLASLLLLFLGVLLARSLFVLAFASGTPFWDQWDAEADRLLRPWLEGTWSAGDWVSAHNEHRIAFSRVLSLTLFRANANRWDNLVEACASAALFALMVTTCCALLLRGESRRAVRWTTVSVAFAMAALPFGWENFLVGFQSQFYFMGLLACAAIGVVAFRAPGRSTWLLAGVLAVASLFTMASGLLTAVAVVAVVVLRNLRDRLSAPALLAWVLLMGAIALAGLAILPEVPPHAALRAQGAAEHASALATTLMWPLQPLDPSVTHWRYYARGALALLVWAPFAAWCLRFLRTREAHGRDLFAAGLALWVLLQALAMAHSRGHDAVAVASRYSEILALGVMVNLWLALQSMLHSRAAAGALARVGGGAYVVVVGLAFAIRTPADARAMIERASAVEVQTRNVRAYLGDGDAAHLRQPFFQIPYPDAERLQQLLDEPTIRSILPDSLRPGEPAGSAAPLSAVTSAAQRRVRGLLGLS